jgi:hypothetical protein
MGLLKIASELAHRFGAELKALYIEDKDWIQASSLSFSQQITSFRGEILQLTEHQITEQSRALAARFEKTVATYSQSLNIKYSYQTVRMQADPDYEQAIAGVDLVLMAGQSPSTEFFITATDKHATPLLVWNNGSGGLREIIGLCINPEESLDIIRWTIQLGNVMNRKSRLFWKQQFDLTDEWIKRLNEDETITAPIIRQKIKDMSQIQAILTQDILQHFRNALFVAHRKDRTINNMETLYHQTPVSVLLL